jgi:pilus assembly protein FimV
LDQKEDALSLDEMASGWGADGQDSPLQAAADEGSEVSPEVGLDAALEPEAVDTVSEIGSETNVELSQDPSTSFEQDIAQSETENLADLDAFLTEIPGNQPPSEQAPSSDLDGMEGAQPVVESEGAFADEDGGEFEEFDVLDEVNTKLDLARAYIDMGDPENARSALEEVLHQGDGEQRKEAEGLIKQIA